MHLIIRISVYLLLCIWLVTEEVNMTTCNNFDFAGLEVKKCYIFDELSILDHIETLSDTIDMKIKISNETIDLHLIKSNRNILNENTTLWNISLDENNRTQSSKSNLYETYPIIKNSQVYVDEQNSAVLRIYPLNDVYIFEGIVGPYQFFYDDNTQIYVYEITTPYVYPKIYSKQIDQKHFNLQSSKKELTMRLLIAGDALYYIPSNEKITWMKNLIHHFSAADYIFSNFSSPSIKLSIAGLILPTDVFKKETNLTEVFLKDEDRQYFAGDNYDVAFFLTKNSMPTIDNIETTWSISAIKIASKITFLNTLDSFNGMDINFLSIADDLAYTIQTEKYLEKFPFFLKVRQSVKNLFDLSNIWNYIQGDGLNSSSRPIDPHNNSYNSTTDTYITSESKSVITYKRGYRKPLSIRSSASIILFDKIDSDNQFYYIYEYIIAGVSVIGLVSAVLLKFKKFFFSKSR